MDGAVMSTNGEHLLNLLVKLDTSGVGANPKTAKQNRGEAFSPTRQILPTRKTKRKRKRNRKKATELPERAIVQLFTSTVLLLYIISALQLFAFSSYPLV